MILEMATVWTLAVNFIMPPQVGQLPKNASITLVFDTEAECKDSPKRNLMLASIVAPNQAQIGDCIPVSLRIERSVK